MHTAWKGLTHKPPDIVCWSRCSRHIRTFYSQPNWWSSLTSSSIVAPRHFSMIFHDQASVARFYFYIVSIAAKAVQRIQPGGICKVLDAHCCVSCTRLQNQKVFSFRNLSTIFRPFFYLIGRIMWHPADNRSWMVIVDPTTVHGTWHIYRFIPLSFDHLLHVKSHSCLIHVGSGHDVGCLHWSHGVHPSRCALLPDIHPQVNRLDPLYTLKAPPQ